MRAYRAEILGGLFLATVTLLALGQVCLNEFVNYDDTKYVTENPHLKAGLTLASLRWAWTDFRYCMWNPLTRMSLLVDHALYGMEAWGYHLTNLLWHLTNVLLLFGLLQRLTGAFWRSLVVAALFAVHPLRVESVAWVTERKDVLSTFFGLLALWAYLRYVERSDLVRYLCIVVAYLLALLAKPMLVTLPFLLLLLDYWPLRRLQWNDYGEAGSPQGSPEKTSPPAGIGRLLGEKLPLFVIAAIFCVITAVTHQEIGAMHNLESVPLIYRAGNGAVAYAQYLLMTIWPTGLTIHYPHPREMLPWGRVAGAAAVLLLISAGAIRMARTRPYFLVGWLWYLGTLIPVIGLVPNNNCPYADRYTYVPHIGLFVLVIWAGVDLAGRWQVGRIVAGCASGLVLGACLVLTGQQVRTWQNSEALWEHALQVTENNDAAHCKIGTLLFQKGRLAEAGWHLREALRLNPRDLAAHINIVTVLVAENNLAEAEQHCFEAFRLNPRNAVAHAKRGSVLELQGKLQEARTELEEALRLDPDFVQAHIGLGQALESQGHLLEADESFRAALRLDPDNPGAHAKLGRVLAREGKVAEGREHVLRALQLEPTYGEAHMNLGILLMAQGDLVRAERHLIAATQYTPNSPETHLRLGALLQRRGELREAGSHLAETIRLQPDCVEAYDNLGVVFEKLGKMAEAVKCYRQAVRLRPDLIDAHCNLAGALHDLGQTEAAAAEYAEASRLDPHWPEAANQAAWGLATHPDRKLRNGPEAVRLARQVCQATGNRVPQFLHTLAASYAELGRFDEAAKIDEVAQGIAISMSETTLAKEIEARLSLYKEHKPYREEPKPGHS